LVGKRDEEILKTIADRRKPLLVSFCGIVILLAGDTNLSRSMNC
jgi:hypothetical protein